MHEAITAFLNPSTYHRCLLLVHADPRRLDQAASELAATHGWPRLSLGQELSAALLPEPPARRPRLARRWLDTRLRDVTDDTPLLCTQIDLLFEPSLKLDPLRLLRDVSRTAPIAVTWPGSYQNDVLAYAVPEHNHYRTWRRPEVLIAPLAHPRPQGESHALP